MKNTRPTLRAIHLLAAVIATLPVPLRPTYTEARVMVDEMAGEMA